MEKRISAESGWRIVPGYPLAPLPFAPGICLFNRLASLDPSQSQGFGPLPLTVPRVAWVSETYAYPLKQKLLKTMAIKAAAAGGRPAKRAFFCERGGHQSRGGRRMSFMISVHPIFPLIPSIYPPPERGRYCWSRSQGVKPAEVMASRSLRSPEGSASFPALPLSQYVLWLAVSLSV